MKLLKSKAIVWVKFYSKFKMWLAQQKSFYRLYHTLAGLCHWLILRKGWGKGFLISVLYKNSEAELDTLISWLLVKRLEVRGYPRFPIMIPNRYNTLFSYQMAFQINSYSSLTYWSNRMPYCFKPVLKAGNTSVLNSLWRLEYKNHHTTVDPDTLVGMEKIHDHIASCGPFNKRHLYPEKREEFFFFSLARNPYTRALSSYLHFARPEDKNRHGFVGFLKCLKNKDPATRVMWNPHWRPVQYYFQFPSDFRELDFVGHLENFDKDISLIIDGIAEVSGVAVNDHEDIIRSELSHSNKSNSKLEQYYDEEAIGLVQDIYIGDFEILGYSTDFDKSGDFPQEEKYRYPRRFYQTNSKVYRQFLTDIHLHDEPPCDPFKPPIR